MFLSFPVQAEEFNFQIELPPAVISGISHELIVETSPPLEGKHLFKVNGIQKDSIIFNSSGQAKASLSFEQKGGYRFQIGSQVKEIQLNPIPLWFSILPPLIAILLALVFKEVLSSLLIGLFCGAFIVQIFSKNVFTALIHAFMTSIDQYILGALNNKGHLSIIIFSLLIGGMVSIISKNGGMQGIVNRISKYANTARNGQLATWFLGVAIFFDDYANTLIVGNTMRPLTDRLKISRQKLAYIVDSTAAPMAAVALITTWVGAELGYIESGIAQIEGLEAGVYATFISSLAYSFYPFLTLTFMFILIYKERDFGPMLRAEKKARTADASEDKAFLADSEMKAFQPKENIKIKPINAILPILVVIFGTIAGLLYTGWSDEIIQQEDLGFFQKLSLMIGASDSYQALLWSSFAGLITAIKLSVFGKILKMEQTIKSLLEGFKTMLPAILILVLAWSLALIIEQLHTADFLTSMLHGNIRAQFIPGITFIMAAVVAFSTGSSWGTMAILYPIMIPTAWSIAQANGLEVDLSLSIFHNTIAGVLAGAVLGDHCSPISDTTILSSLAGSCNHIEHVKTQMPYALTVGGVAILFGILPAGFGMPPWIGMLSGIGVLFLIIHIFGKKATV